MANGIYTAEMGNPPSPDEGPTYDHLKDPTIQKKVIDALVKSGMNINVTSFEMYHQKGKLYIKTAEGFSIEFRRGEHYKGVGDNLQFLPTSIQYIKDTIKRYNNEVKSLQKQFHSLLDPQNSQDFIQSA